MHILCAGAIMGYDWASLKAKLEILGQHIKRPTRLVLVGGLVGMSYGQPNRKTADIDVWSPRSSFDFEGLRWACQLADVAFDPKTADAEESGLFLQLVRPTDVVDFGRWDAKKERLIGQFGALSVMHPPAENLIASKLVRSEIKDIDDVVYLISKLDVPRASIEKAIATLPRDIADIARENSVFLDVLMPDSAVAAELQDSAPRKPKKHREATLGL